MDEARGAERRSADSDRGHTGPEDSKAWPDYDRYSELWLPKQSLVGVLVALLAHRSAADIAVFGTLVCLCIIGWRLAAGEQLTPLRLVAVLAVALMISAFGTVVFVVGRKKNAEAAQERGYGTAQSSGQHDGAGEAGEPSRRDRG